jgi:hypothetical protein
MRTAVLVLLAMIVFGGSAAGQEVTVLQPVADGEATVAVKAKALERGFAEAAVQASMEILPGSLSEKRQKLLMDYLAPRTRDLVLSYAELEYQQTWTELMLRLDVRINRQVLKRHLREAGVFYTSVEPWPYALTMGGGAPGDFQALDNLQILTGVVVRPGADPALTLQRVEGGAWKGELRTSGQVITETNQDLSALWFKIWGRYFSLPEVQARVMRTAVLITEGWANARQAASFDRELNGWDRLVEEAQLMDIDIGQATITSRWLLKVRNSDLLMGSLKERLSERGIRFSFQSTAEGEPDAMRP